MRDMDNDTIIYIFAAALFGPPLAATVLTPVRDFLLHWHVLTTTGVLIPVAPGIGLDLARVLLAAGVLGLLIVAGTTTARRRRARRERVQR